MRFQDIIGQEEIKKQLVELVKQNRLSHALLFAGKEGCGSLPLAIAFAQYLTCEKVNPGKKAAAGPSLFGEPEPVETVIPDEPCGQCASCVKANQLAHPDIHFSYPTVTTKEFDKPVATDFIQPWREFIKLHPYGNAFDWIELIKEKENSQGKITANECNEIIRKLSLKSFESEYKVLVMWMPESMGPEGNKLLKLIEEPPANTLFILVTENEEQVLQTIVSRCQAIRIPQLQIQEIEEALISRNHTEPHVARQVALVSEGNYHEALQLVQHAEEDWQGMLREWLNATLKTGPVAQTKWVEEVARLGREKQKQFLRYFNHLLEQALRLRVTGDVPGLGAAEKDFAQRLNKIAGLEQQEAIVEVIDDAVYFIERNANAKILFHALTIKLYHIIQDKIVFLTD